MNRRHFAFALALLLSAALTAATAQDNQRPPSNTVAAERVIQIIWDQNAPPPDINGVLAELLGLRRAGDVAQRVLNVKPEVGQRLIWTEPSIEITDHACKIKLRAAFDPAKTAARPAAKEFADGVVELLPPLLRLGREEASAGRLDRVRREVDELERQLEALRRRSREKQAELRAVSGRADLSIEPLQAGISKLEDERQRIEIDLAGMEARLQAVQEQIAEATKLAGENAAADPVIAELEKAEAARQKMLDLTRKRFEVGHAQQTEVANAEAALIEARVQLLDRRVAAAARGGDALSPLTREMQNLGIDIRDRQARLRHIKERLDQLGKVYPEYEELELTREESESVRRAWEAAQDRLREATRQLDAAPVDRVIVTLSRDTPAQ